MKMRGYYFITDAGLSRAGDAADVACAETAGACFVQYRCKDGTTAKLYREAKALKALCHRTPFLINDRVDIALAVDADGVHIGQDDMPFAVARCLLGPDKIIGLTVHNLAEAQAGAALGADYLGVSPIFSTNTKKDAGVAAGPDLIRTIRAEVDLPLAAIGGITQQNAPEVIAAGADMICAISAVVCDTHPAERIADFQNMF